MHGHTHPQTSRTFFFLSQQGKDRVGDMLVNGFACSEMNFVLCNVIRNEKKLDIPDHEAQRNR